MVRRLNLGNNFRVAHTKMTLKMGVPEHSAWVEDDRRPLPLYVKYRYTIYLSNDRRKQVTWLGA